MIILLHWMKSLEVVMGDLRSLAEVGKAVAKVTLDFRLKKYADNMIYLANSRVTKK